VAVCSLFSVYLEQKNADFIRSALGAAMSKGLKWLFLEPQIEFLEIPSSTDFHHRNK